MEDNWISIKDDKPEKGVAVLIYLKKSGFITIGYLTTPSSEEYTGAWQMFGDTHMIVYPDDIVTHWMPLPSPPKP